MRTFLDKWSSKIFTKEEIREMIKNIPVEAPPKDSPFATGDRIAYQESPKSITSNIGRDPKMKEAMKFSDKTGKEIGYQINRTKDGSLVLGQKTEGFKGSLVNAKTGNTGFFHTHPDKTIVDGFSRSDFAHLLTDKNMQMLAIRNTQINHNGWIAIRTKGTPVMTGSKSVSWQLKGRTLSASSKEKFVEAYAKALLRDLKKD